jgi:hypothetical protein
MEELREGVEVAAIQRRVALAQLGFVLGGDTPTVPQRR